MVSACTIIARNYLAHARVLASSFFSHHPDGNFTVLLIDDESREFDAGGEVFRSLRLGDIGLDRVEIGRLAAIYEVTELATAVKPLFLRHLLSAGRSDVIYLDPDIRICDSLEEVSRLAREHAIVLTPHTTVPVPRDGRRIDEFQILAAGIYNLGFIAVGPGSEAFIDWWWKKTRREARSDPLRMMFTDQRWVDFVPGFFDHFILKDPAYNVAYWNLHGRDLTWNGTGYLVDRRPLKFFHFSGFDAKKPYLLSKHQGDHPRILLSEHPALDRICQEYVASLEQAGHAQESILPYGWNALPAGIPFNRRMRRVYREALGAFEEGHRSEPPGPFDVGSGNGFMDWLNEPVSAGLRPRVSRYLYSIYQDRRDLQNAFPDLASDDVQQYFEWIRRHGVVEEKIPAQLLPPRPSTSETSDVACAPESGLTKGVNIAGYFQAEAGVGEAARLLTSAVEAAGIPHSTIAYDGTLSRKAHAFLERGDGRALHDLNIVCVNADQIPAFTKEVGRHFFEGRRTAGYWFWELEHFPAIMHSAFDYVDEVWTATRFVASSIQAIGRRPVYTIPLPVPVPRCSPDVTRSSLRLPPGFMFLFIFDFFSVLERKNPFGLIEAFERAFRLNEGPILVIKTINGDSRLNDLEKVRAAARYRPDVFIIDEYYSAEEKNSLLGLCDCYVSLHRSEGFGLTMAEAMGLGKPVIATGYSGNLDFMTPDNSYLVDYVKSAVPDACGPYPKGIPWADPNIDQAAEYMRRIYEAPQEAGRKARLGRQDILTKHNVSAAAVVLKQRFEEITRARGRVAVPAELQRAKTVSGDSATAAERTEVPHMSSLDQIAPILTPVPNIEPGRRFRRPLLMAQRLLFRILRPYWWQQRDIQTLLIAGVREAAGIGQMQAAEAANSERHQRKALESLWTAVHTLEARTSEDDLKRLEAQNTTVRRSVSAFQETAATHVKALTDQLAFVTSQLSTLSHRLYQVPHIDDPSRFYCTDERGRRVLGFRSKRTADGDVHVGFADIFRGS